MDKYEIIPSNEYASESSTSYYGGEPSSTSYYGTDPVESDSLSMTLLDGVFFKYVPEKSSYKTTVGLCLKCLPNTVEIKGHNKSSSNFVTHLKRKHGPETVEEYRKYLKDNRGKRTFRTADQTLPKNNSRQSISQERFTIDLMNYIIHSMIPLRTIEDPYFVQMMDNRNIKQNGQNVPSLLSLRAIIAERSFEEICEIRETLASVDYISTTADVWSDRRQGFFGVTVHWIDDDLQRQSAAIACSRFTGSLTSDKISSFLQEIYLNFSFNSSKVVASITDYGSNFVEAFKMFGVKMKSLAHLREDHDSSKAGDEVNKDECETKPIVKLEANDEAQHGYRDNSFLSHQIKSCAQTLSLAASVDLQSLMNDEGTSLGQLHTETIRKCSELWNAAEQPESTEIFQNVLGYTLSRPEPTRWNTLHNALKQISKLRNQFLQLFWALGLEMKLKDVEFDYLDEFVQCTEPIAVALDILQGDDSFYGIVLPCLLALRNKLQKLSRLELKYCKPFVDKYIERIEIRFDEFFNPSGDNANNAIIAALSHPRFKNKWFVYFPSTYHQRCNQLLISAMCDEISRTTQEMKVGNQYTSDVKIEHDDFFDFSSNVTSENEISNNCPRRRAEIIAANFFADESREINLLQHYPLMKNVFIKYNTPMPSSGPGERMFSFASINDLPKSYLFDDMFEKRVVMRSNLNYFKK